ncbi:DUF5655 domain-containing protein [Ornithinimicrobium sp. F0845]|uniref:DUF5655 domain-containing protein n=1 Tax=Ornithinimicrobium sp. F0845 TaxID=2926412 RepID=UPI001FF6A93B|nr:DUF5655 domain-containing protein [Ornithinimicrobium sp. F0845]MCK0112096.1 DUF5655 domain-containing protein [Ornithinimicrobium sp. F0845]
MSTSWTVDDHLRDKPAANVVMFHRFVELVGDCGPFEFSPSKSTVTFKGVRRGFAGARPTAAGLTVYLDLQRELADDPRVGSVSPYTSRLFVHHLRLTSLDQFDAELAGWIREAYAVGAGEHLG